MWDRAKEKKRVWFAGFKWGYWMARGVQTYWVTRIFSNPARVHIHQPAQFTASWHIPVLRREKERERERETGIAMTETKTEVFCALKISALFSLCIWHRFGSSKRRLHAVIFDKHGADSCLCHLMVFISFSEGKLPVSAPCSGVTFIFCMIQNGPVFA